MLHVFSVSVDTTAMIVQLNAFPFSGNSGADIVMPSVLDIIQQLACKRYEEAG